MTKTLLVITFDVSGFTDAQIDSLALHAIVQGEACDDEETEERCYPDVRDTSFVVTRDGVTIASDRDPNEAEPDGESYPITLGDYRATGVQDCANAIEPSEFDVRDGIRKGWTAAQIVDHTLNGEDWQDRDAWIEQQESDDIAALGADVMWDAWKAGWRERAIGIVQRWIDERCAVCGGLDEGNTCCP